MRRLPWLDPEKEPCIFSPPESPPIPGLSVYRGYGCPYCAFVTRKETIIFGKHRGQNHHDRRRPPGRQPHSLPDRPPSRILHCQRFFSNGKGSQFFAVTPLATAERVGQAGKMNEADFVQAQVNQALQQSWDRAAGEQELISTNKDFTEASPWLELTRWPEYLGGYAFADVVPLAALPDVIHEPLLVIFAQSIERLIQAAYQSIKDQRINEFDQVW